MSSLKILVTGGVGFIGSSLVDRLIKEGHDVVVIDDLSTGDKSYLNEKARFYEMDIRDSDIFRIFRRENFDIVYHLASKCDVRKAEEDPAEDVAINIEGTVNILKNCAEYNVKKIIFTSTMAIYEDKENINERSNISPITLNALSKKAAEDYIIKFSKEYGLEYSILRLSNVYGVRQNSMNDGGIIYMALDKIYAKSVPILFGDEFASRDFIFVMDVIEACMSVINKGSNEIYNIAYGEAISQKNLYEMIIGKTKPGLSYMKGGYRKGDMDMPNVNIGKAKAELGWEPMFSIEDGIEITTQYYKREKRV